MQQNTTSTIAQVFNQAWTSLNGFKQNKGHVLPLGCVGSTIWVKSKVPHEFKVKYHTWHFWAVLSKRGNLSDPSCTKMTSQAFEVGSRLPKHMYIKPHKACITWVRVMRILDWGIYHNPWRTKWNGSREETCIQGRFTHATRYTCLWGCCFGASF